MKDIFPEKIIGTFQIISQNEMDNIVNAAISSGCFAFDTAPSYGSESLLGEGIRRCVSETCISREQMFIQDKIDPIQMYYCDKKKLEEFVKKQLLTMRLEYLDCLLIHWPLHKYFSKIWESMLDLKRNGWVKKIGVCNIDIRGYENLFISNSYSNPDVIQNEISPLNTDKENIEYFFRKGIIVEAYSPLCRMDSRIKESPNLINIANQYGADVARIVLKWHIQNGIVPIFTSRKAKRITDNLKLDFELKKDELEMINLLNDNYKIFPLSHGCPGY